MCHISNDTRDPDCHRKTHEKKSLGDRKLKNSVKSTGKKRKIC